MDRIIIIAGAVLFIFGLGFGIMELVRRLTKKKMKRWLYVVLSLVLSFVIIFSAAAVYFGIHYSSDEIALEVMASDREVSITKADNGYLFDGAGENSLFVFFQGAKVDCEAYSPLMQRIAAGGVDCFLVSSPLRMAFINFDPIANGVIDSYEYKSYVLGGHSLGGVAASAFAADNPDKVDGLVLLASYPTKQLSDDTSLLLIYGSCDGVLDLEAYNNAKQYYPSNSEEIIIAGGNHSGFGKYGSQRGDNEAEITSDEQQRNTAEAIVEFCDRIV